MVSKKIARMIRDVREFLEQNNLQLMNLEPILDHDLPEGDWVSNELVGLIETEYLTNAVKLKKDSYK